MCMIVAGSSVDKQKKERHGRYYQRGEIRENMARGDGKSIIVLFLCTQKRAGGDHRLNTAWNRHNWKKLQLGAFYLIVKEISGILPVGFYGILERSSSNGPIGQEGVALGSPIPCTRKVSARGSSLFETVTKLCHRYTFVLPRLYGCGGSEYRGPSRSETE